MFKLSDWFAFSFPLQNPVLIFSLILFIILFAPIIFNKFKVPHLIGLIIAGVIIGPHGLNFMLRDSSIILFGTVGLLYIMFLAGLEIDMQDFKRNSIKGIVFGIYTFVIPMIIGYFASYYLLKFSLISSILLASMFASHTLIAYPIISKLGIAKNRAVSIAVSGTVITDTLALLVLAVIVGVSAGEVNDAFWIRLLISILLFGSFVLFVFPILARWFFKRYSDSISQYIFVLALLFLAAFLSQLAGIEAIIGAFLAGLALNRLIPSTSPLMNRIEFVGNALFIPIFLIGVGMLMDFKAFFTDITTIWVAFVMTFVAIISKFLAAWLTQKTFKLSIDERRIIFGLSNAQAAATLAAVLLGYNIITGYDALGNPIRLLNDSVLNGTVLMILVTCTIASIIAQKGAQNIALSNSSDIDSEPLLHQDRVLIPIGSPEYAEELINLCVAFRSKKNVNEYYALHVLDSNAAPNKEMSKGEKILEMAAKAASASDINLYKLLRYDVNLINGITSVVREHNINDLFMGLHRKYELSDSFLGNITEGVLNTCNTTTFIYKASQPLSTYKRALIVVPDRAEKEIGFPFWLLKIWNLARNIGLPLVFYGAENTLSHIKLLQKKHPIPSEFIPFSDWDDFLIILRDIRPDDHLTIILSRKERPSYHSAMAKVPLYLNKYFSDYGYLLIYPMQSMFDVEESSIGNPAIHDPFKEFDDISKSIMSMFKKKFF